MLFFKGKEYPGNLVYVRDYRTQWDVRDYCVFSVDFKLNKNLKFVKNNIPVELPAVFDILTVAKIHEDNFEDTLNSFGDTLVLVGGKCPGTPHSNWTGEVYRNGRIIGFVQQPNESMMLNEVFLKYMSDVSDFSDSYRALMMENLLGCFKDRKVLFSSDGSILKNLSALREMARDDVFDNFSFVDCGDFGFWGKILCDLLNKDDEYNIPYGFVEKINTKANVNDMTLTYPLSKKDGTWKVKECNNPLSVLNLATMVLLTP